MSDGRTSGAAVERANWSWPRERQTARATILSAARALAEREGSEAVTLSAVARETKIARAAIYSHFSSRHELIAALSEAPAEEMRDSATAVSSTAEMEGAAAESETPTPEAPEQTHEEAAIPEEAATFDGGYDELMRSQAEALQQLTKQVIVSKPRQRDPTDAALSRMEARLAVAEQSFAALEQKVGERLKALGTETGSLAGTLQTLRSRVEKFEDRQQAALAQLRLDVHNLRHGEPVNEAAAPEPIPDIVPADVVAEPAPEPVTETEGADAEPQRVPFYLCSARQAAINAAAQVTAEPRPKPKIAVKRFLRRNRWTLIAVAAVLVAWFDFYVFAQYEPAQGGIAAPASIASVAKPRPVLTPRAQLIRGLKYLNGTGVPINVDKARHWLERAALRGQPVAQNLMGVLYQTGTGVPEDMATAIRWYEVSAQHGNLKAMTNLGKLYAGGWKEGTDFAKSAEWFSKAAAYGEVDAQFDLAILYERGEGVARSMSEAYKWYGIAGRNGDRHAADRAAMLASQLSIAELHAADNAIVLFRPIAANRSANEIPATKS